MSESDISSRGEVVFSRDFRGVIRKLNDSPSLSESEISSFELLFHGGTKPFFGPPRGLMAGPGRL